MGKLHAVRERYNCERRSAVKVIVEDYFSKILLSLMLHETPAMETTALPSLDLSVPIGLLVKGFFCRIPGAIKGF